MLVLPFHVAAEDDDKELRSFAVHVDKKIRSVVDQLGGELEVADEETTARLLRGRSAPSTDGEAQALAEESKADLVVYGVISARETRYHMRGVMWDMGSGRVSVATDLKVDNIHGLPGVLQLFVTSISKRLHGSPRLRFYRTGQAGSFSQSDRLPTLVNIPGTPGPWMSQEIRGALAAVDVGDMDGDKKNETVFVEDRGITISRFENGSLRTLTQFSESPAQYIAADVADLDGDGVAELLLCYLTPAGLESAIVRYVNRNFEVTEKLKNTILWAVNDPTSENEKILLGQRTDTEDMFNGEMVRFRFEGGKVFPAGRTALPPGTLLLSYESGRLGKDKSSVQAILNQDQRVMVFDRENRLLDTISDRIYGLNRTIRIPHKGGYRRVSLPGRVLIADTDGDGGNELLLVKHRDGGSVVQGLSWDDGRLSEKWKTIRSEGSITDFRIRDFKNEGIDSLVLILVKPNPFMALTGPRSVVFAYDLVP
ncbi:MAG: VCBS repeat-containing protein [Desulfomonilaceae bacterium]|nr:VCBS repeat-containing protein [Desulfomonilaceae bacterium]